MKTYSLKPKDISRTWYILDASQVPLGRLATAAAGLFPDRIFFLDIRGDAWFKAPVPPFFL